MSDLELSKELTDSIIHDVDNSTHKYLKFDDYGTVHIIERDNNDRLIRDTPLEESKEVMQEPIERTNMVEELDNVQKVNKTIKVLSVIAAMLFIYLIIAAIVLSIVKTTGPYMSSIVLTMSAALLLFILVIMFIIARIIFRR